MPAAARLSTLMKILPTVAVGVSSWVVLATWSGARVEGQPVSAVGLDMKVGKLFSMLELGVPLEPGVEPETWNQPQPMDTRNRMGSHILPG